MRDDLTGAIWRKSSRSGNATAECVEVATTATRVGVRDSKDRDGGTLVFSRAQWSAFIADVKQR